MAEAVSEEFWNAFCDTASMEVQCGCGVLYFASGDGDWNPGEKERLQKLAAKEPKKYVDNVDFTRRIDIAGTTFVAGCPCLEERLTRYEAFVWGNRHMIASYLTARTNREFEEAKWNREGAYEVVKAGDLEAAKRVIESLRGNVADLEKRLDAK